MLRFLTGLIEFAVGFGVVVLVVQVAPTRQLDVKQPIEFNHKKHVDAGWACVNCHPFAEDHSFAGLPTAKECVECHETEMPRYPQNQKMKEITEQLRKLVEEGRDIPWVKVHKVADHVYFSHRRHVTIAKLECKECHGEVEKMEKPFTAPAFPLWKVPLTQRWLAYNYSVRKMNWCVACHEQKGAPTDCMACHR